MSSVVSSIFGGGGNAPGQVQSPISQAQTNQSFGNVQTGLDQQQAFLQALQAQNGIGNQSNVFDQMQGVVDGTGPNPAQTQLAQATGANVANQNALMAGQRGSSANSGLMARQAAMQGANTQQQAAGQAATMQANQSLNALGQMGNIAGQQVNNQGQAAQGYTNAANQQLNTGVGAQNQTNSINSGAQQAQAAQQGQMLGNVMGAIGTGAGMLFGGPAGAAVGGGLAKNMLGPKPTTMMAAEGGQVPGPQSYVTRHMMAHGGSVPALVSPGEQYLPPQAAQAVAQGQAKPLSVGERIPGKPKVAGNSYANDTVPKTLQEGGVVIPNSIMQSKDAEKKAAEFVRQVMSKKQGLPSKGSK